MNTKKWIFLSGLLLLTLLFSIGFAAPQPEAAYIVQAGDMETAARLVEEVGGAVTSRLAVIDGVGALLSEEAVAQLLSRPAIRAITPNSPVELVFNTGDTGAESGGIPATDYADVVGADYTWQQGVTGAGVTVAVVDTGIAPLTGVRKDIDGGNQRIVGWVDFVENRNQPKDDNGHGTHISGIIANSQIGADSEWNGIAPGVNLVGVRVLDETGSGTYEKVIQGIQWVIDNKDAYNIRVMNLSLVSTVQSPYWADPLNQAVMAAWAEGIVVVAAAGNGGPAAMTIGVPGNTPYIITVGAFTDDFTPYDWNDDYLASFSAAGPTLDGFIKPDVVAPGAHMVSTMSGSSYLAQQYPDSKVHGNYYSLAGTSQAAAVVSGIAALALSENPDLTPDQVKYRIMNGAFVWIDMETTDALYSVWQQGFGRASAPDATFSEALDAANWGLDVEADLAGEMHYEGFSYFDEVAGEFRLRGEYASWAGGFGSWAGGFGSWAGGFGSWAGGFGSWAGGFGSWAGGFGSWAGGFGSWAGGFGSWAGGFGSWAGGFGSWAGSYGDAAFAEQFVNWDGTTLPANWAQTQTFIGNVVEP